MAQFGDFPPGHSGHNDTDDRGWERRVLEELAFAALKEQRKSRRWSYVFKSLTLLCLVAFLLMLLPSNELPTTQKTHTAMVQINGEIAADAEANADNIVTAIKKAFDNPHAKGLILRMNTPGGSPVQAGIINDEIKRLKKTRPNFPVYAVVQDMCASGGYYIAVAADKIFADKASIVGSIGVRMDGFGFTGIMQKLGVERRSLTAGDHKAFLDPFQPMKPSEVAFAHKMLDNIHQQFIKVVKEGRGKRLKNNPELFSGLFWSGQQALKLGLIDGLADSRTVARDIIGAPNIVDYTIKPNYWDRFASKLGASISQTALRASNWSLN